MLKLYPKNNPPQRIKEVVDILNDGGVIKIGRAHV